ncbi:pre-rRNA processing protein [Paramarasmius palmivorus]|uniref:Pre-rRNA processing protein n=1 Tax=Paramarasmius palmivorus TaxID=297713 RepID=A0AAW0C960_9AGAR
MEQALSKIRVHKFSSLLHQKAPANLLIALESTLDEQKTERTPTAYFAALLTTLDGTIQKKDVSLNEGDVLPAELYLLALVSPFVAVPVIRANLNTLLSLTAPLFPSLLQHAPPLRSQLTLYHVVFSALDRSQLETHGIRQAFATILQLCLDPRPKVRKKAAEVVKDVLSKPPSPLARHPYADRVADWTVSNLSNTGKSSASKNPGSDAESHIHVLAMLRPILPYIPPSTYPTITTGLLHLPRLGNPYLSQSAYSVMSNIFALSRDDNTFDDGSILPEVLKTILNFPPTKSDTTSTPAWLSVLGDAMSVFKEINPTAFSSRAPNVWKTIWPYLESNNGPVRQAAAQSINSLCRCSVSLDEKADGKLSVDAIVAQISKAFTSVAFTKAIPELLSISSSLIADLQQGGPVSQNRITAVQPLIVHIGGLRIEKNFEHKEAADTVLSTVVRILGPEILLKMLPLNLEPENRKSGGEPRAFLLPLLAQPHPSSLSHFASYFVPLSERMFDLQNTAESEGRQSEAKMWSVLVSQIWNGFPGYCYGTVDLKEALTQQFSQLLSQVLYSQPDLRPPILRGLKVMVDSNVAIKSGDNDAINPSFIRPDQAARNLDFLRTQAENWLAVLFNVFGSVNRDSRGSMGEVIAAWASISDENALSQAHSKVVNILKAELPKLSAEKSAKANDDESTALMALDLLLLLLPFLPVSDAAALFQLCLSREILTANSNGVQKRAYKILTKLVEGGKIPIEAEKVLRELDSAADDLTSAAKKDRFNLLAAILPHMPSSSLHLIPAMIPEAVLGTKETSDKARSAAFELIVVMGKKMSEGGVVKRNMIDGMEEDGEDVPMEATANIEEFLKMVAGGLAGSTPHMVSATITALSRLVFDFKEEISNSMKKEVFTTLLVFLNSANREIVKSILGFVKLSIHTFPVEIIQSHLKDLVPSLLNWSHDHKNHFKVKVRHIFERLLRRIPFEEVYSHAGEGDVAKVLVNIKKRKERAKRKKASKEEEEEEDPAAKTAPATGDAFEDIIYGSESELEDSDDEAAPRKETRVNRKAKQHGIRLRMDDDEPMDLLQGVASRVTNAAGNKKRKPGQEASRFKTDEDTGKMIIDGEDSDDAGAGAGSKEDVVGTAYREAITGVDGFTRGPNGRIKFNKDTKKRRRENEELEDDAMDVVEDSSKKQKTKNPKLGQDFKAKRAGGDVKKGGVDPYAYVTLSQASKKSGGRKNRIGIAGKR